MMITLAALFPLLALLPLASAQLPASAPHCVATCLQAKINEAGSLAPGVQPSDVAGLCATSAFVEAYDNCLSENCSSDEADTGRSLRKKLCAAASTSATLTGSAATKLASASSSAESMASDATSEAEGSVFTTVATASPASGTSNSGASGSDSISSSVASITSSLASEVSSRAQALSSSYSNRVVSVSSKASSLSSAASASGSAAAASASQGDGNGAFAVASPSIFTAFLSSVVLGALAVIV
ncbi:hypothetical protein RHOSPDRAFT_33317 [Rhodotorula sp. JG-1b]|nr:hypothetical protein RHOSPDRAFT_33317 [Rhodotorula sp. JG-1b]